ncbi:type I DNA topoisomerase, partial [Candidatus Uhrbacteria bacterium]|nr:type I DNA topoisomerase [Candidatus Uhrbacteria bacterium]
MAKRLVIVESPTKAKTVQKMLGASFDVVSSFGHIRDLPKSKLGVDVEHAYAPQYVIPPDKRARVTALKAAAKSAENIFLATDDDREGEAIAWHIAHVLNMDVKSAKRIVFHEITKHAVDHALNSPRSINIDLVDAQQARRVLDRLVGYELSPFLWKKVARGLSAGRVQSVAVRFVVERERERQAFKSETYFSIEGDFVHANGPFHANLLTFHGDKMQKMGIKTREQADDMLRDIQSAAYRVGNIETSPRKREPKPPFKTSTLQQEANNKLGMSSKLTMRVAQQLYEGVSLGSEGMTGLITYMRTDSFNLSEQFILGARAYAQQTFGKEYVSPSPRVFKTTAKGAQEAHEAIRPTDPSRTPESIKHHLDPRQFKLYDLIWRRAIATQMATAQLKKEAVAVESDAAHFQATGSVIVFPGFLALYKDSVKETVLPNMSKGDDIAAEKIEAQEHVTEPPGRYSDATLVKVLEEHGIGRPSTYAPTISTILDRGYVERDEQKRLAPTDIAFTVNDLLVEHFPNIVDAAFTARMESELD